MATSLFTDSYPLNKTMAKTSFINVPVESEDKYYESVQTMDRFIIPRIRQKTALFSKSRILSITARSYMSQCVTLWNAFTDEQRQAWKAADPHFRQHGFRTFFADQTQRIKLALAGVSTPNQYHQNMVGKLLIQNPAEEIKIVQLHPSSYFINSKVAGKKNMYEPVEITESFQLPLKIGINFKSDLVSTGDGSFAHFYAAVRHLYQGQNLNYDLTVDIPLQSAWDNDSETVSELSGVAVSYDLYIHLYKVTGTLLIDNVQAIHSSLIYAGDYGDRDYGLFEYAEWLGQNWARDPFCKKIEQAFSRGFSQILPNWGSITLPTGSSYLSIYGGE